MDRGEQFQQPPISCRRLIVPTGKDLVALGIGGNAGKADRGRRLPQMGDHGQKGQMRHDPFGLEDQLAFGGVRAGLEQ